MDRIVLTGVHANGTHGVLEFEHERAQPFVVDATLYMDLTAAGASDDLNDTVDYGRAAKEIVAVIEGEHADLIEHLAQRIADRLLTMPPVCQVDVTVHKPHAPITVPFDDVAVSITRMRRNPAGEAETESHARQSGRQEEAWHGAHCVLKSRCGFVTMKNHPKKAAFYEKCNKGGDMYEYRLFGHGGRSGA